MGLNSEVQLESYRTDDKYILATNKVLKNSASQMSTGGIKLTPKYLENRYKNMEKLPELEKESTVLQNRVTGSFIKQAPFVQMEGAGGSQYDEHMKNLTAYKLSMKSLRSTIHHKQFLQKSPGSPRTSTLKSYGDKMVSADGKSDQFITIQGQLLNHKKIENKILNTQFLKERKDFKNPISLRARSTFGNPNRQDKFDRGVYLKEISHSNNRGRCSPAPNIYNQSSCFDESEQPTMPKAKRDFDKILAKKDAAELPSPGQYHTQSYLTGEYGTYFTRNPQK